jgi:hypothetical protein
MKIEGVSMFVKLNERVYLNADRITRIKIDEVQDGIRVRFYEGQVQVAKSQKFPSVEAASSWIENMMNKK